MYSLIAKLMYFPRQQPDKFQRAGIESMRSHPLVRARILDNSSPPFFLAAFAATSDDGSGDGDTDTSLEMYRIPGGKRRKKVGRKEGRKEEMGGPLTSRS